MNRLLVHATRPSKTAFEKCGPRGHLRTGTTTRRPHAALTRTSPAVDDFCHALIGQWIPPAVTASKSRSSIGFIKPVLPRTHLESGPNHSRLYVRFEDDCQGIANDIAVCSYLPTLLQISPDGRRILRRSVSCAPHSPLQSGFVPVGCPVAVKALQGIWEQRSLSTSMSSNIQLTMALMIELRLSATTSSRS